MINKKWASRNPLHYKKTNHFKEQKKQRNISTDMISKAIMDGDIKKSTRKPHCRVFATDTIRVIFDPNVDELITVTTPSGKQDHL